MKRSLFLCFIFLILAYTVSAQEPSSASTGKLDERVAQKINELFKDWDKQDLPGCSIAIIDRGKIVYKRGYGMANLDHNVPNTPATVFNVASMSKQFTAMSIALLAEQGKLSLDDNIRKYVPELREYAFPITIKHLIYHTSGLRDYTNLIELSDDRIENIHTDKDILSILARQKGLNFKPGTEHVYDNSGYVLLGIIVERVSGKTLGEFQREFIFEPLGMKNTRLYDDRTMIVRSRAAGYFRKGENSYAMRASLWDRIGDGGLLTTVEDLFLWDQNFYEPKVGSRELIKRLSVPGTLNNGEKFEYAFGLEPVQYRGLPMVMHGGGINGYRAQMFRFPEQQTTLICLCNSGAISPTAMLDRIADIYLGGSFVKATPETSKVAVEATPAVSLPEKELSRFESLYANPLTDTVRRVYLKNGKLWYQRNANSESELSPMGGNRFSMLGVSDKVEVTFQFDTGKPVNMSLAINGGKPVAYTSVKPARETSEQLAGYAGIYYSDELDTSYAFVVEGSKLIVRRRTVPDVTLSPRYMDVFTNEDSLGRIKFLRGKAGRVTGFVLNASQVRGLQFRKIK